MASGELHLTGVSGKNCNGVSYGSSSIFTMSGGTKGEIHFTIAANAINDGKPAIITGIYSKTVCYDYTSQDTFNHYIIYSDRYSKAVPKSSFATVTYGETTINYLNGLRDEGKCFSTAQTITLHIADTSTGNGNSRMKPSSQHLYIQWESINPFYIHNGTEFVEATPYVYTEGLWVAATPMIYQNGEWKG